MNQPSNPNSMSTADRPYLSCREVLDFLMSYTDGEMSGEQRREFDRHLSVCPSCVNYLDGYKQTIALGKAAHRSSGNGSSGSVPDSLVQAIRASRNKH